MTIKAPKPVDLAVEPSVTDDPRWQQIVERNRSADGKFWYSVETTGVYCRPSCASRAANPRNVQIHDTLDSARTSGFRACKRCNPDGDSAETINAALVEKACRIIEQSETPPSLDELADAVELSPGYFHRMFKRVTGLTPKAYADAQQAKRMREGLGGAAASVTDAIYAAGYSSSSRLYEKSNALLGMTPTRYRGGGAQERIRFAVGQSSLGAILVASTDKGVVAILLGDDPETLLNDLEKRFPKADLVGGDRAYEERVARIVGFVEAPDTALDLPLDIRGSAFQQRVWEALRKIPAGATASYADIARQIGEPLAVRAVAGACASNKLAIAIPCHRVVRSDGALSGYAWGIDRKRQLLELERRGA
jgi:AraC family transcriptional regulator of adaptative response/methylated-DNA-[protein]-cysteine methyltransferase